MAESDRLGALKGLLYEVNKNLPSFVYVPFFRGKKFDKYSKNFGGILLIR